MPTKRNRKELSSKVQSVLMMPPNIADIPLGMAESFLSPFSGMDMEEEVRKLMSQSETYDADILIIGSGPGGYVAAIRAAQLGARTVCIEKNPQEWGGVCLNWGCIPTKAMIASVERLHAAKQSARMGVLTGDVDFDFEKIMERKTKIVQTLRGGVESLLKSNKVRKVVGVAKLTGPHSVEVTSESGEKETITSRTIIVATGSSPILPPIPGLEGEGIWTSNEAVSAKFVPKSMLIIGAGAVGLEFSYVYNGLGAKCTVVEIMPEILPIADAEAASELRKSLKKLKIDFHVNSKVSGVQRKDGGYVVTVSTEKGEIQIEAEVILVGAGRRPNLDGIGLEDVGVAVEKRGVIVDEKMQTNIASIYAIGDVTGKMALAHVASHQGIVAVENAMGHPAKMDYRAVPSPVFTEPEMAWVGMTEKEARDAGYDVAVGKFPFRPLGKSMAIDQQDGMVKIVSERKYGEVLGVHIVGPHASDLIHEAVMAIKLEATVEELMTMVHAHPTLAEAILEASLDTMGRAIHKLK